MPWGAIALSIFAAFCVLAPAATAASAAAALTARGSAEQVQVTGAWPGQRLVLTDRRGRRVATHRADSLGGALFRHVAAGHGYRVAPAAAPRRRSAAVTVFSNRPAPPRTRIYHQRLPSGYG